MRRGRPTCATCRSPTGLWCSSSARKDAVFPASSPTPATCLCRFRWLLATSRLTQASPHRSPCMRSRECARVSADFWGSLQLEFGCALVVSSTLECGCEPEGVGGVPGHLVRDGTSLVRGREAARSRLPGGAAHRDRRAVACRRAGSHGGLRPRVVGGPEARP